MKTYTVSELLDQSVEDVKSILFELGWQPMKTAPHDTPIMGWCIHEFELQEIQPSPSSILSSPAVVLITQLTTYAAHCEALYHATNGPHIVAWGGKYHEYSWEYSADMYIPDWWFVDDGKFETVAAPVAWKHIL